MPQERRMGENEAVFREVNERIRGVSSDQPHEFDAICECTDPACREPVTLLPGEYEAVRANGARFVVAPGHDSPPIERAAPTRTSGPEAGGRCSASRTTGPVVMVCA